MRTALHTAALLAVTAALALLFAVLTPQAHAGTGSPAPVSPAATSELGGGTGVSADLAVLDAASPEGEQLTPAQAAQILTAADQVCEGLTAGVPEGMMIRTVADAEGLPLDAAHAFIEAAMTRCAR